MESVENKVECSIWKWYQFRIRGKWNRIRRKNKREAKRRRKHYEWVNDIEKYPW